MRVGCIVQARMASSRLPGKALLPTPDGRTLLAVLLARVKQATAIDGIVLAITEDRADDVLVDAAAAFHVPHHSGHAGRLLDQFTETAQRMRWDAVVRITGDCPLVDPRVIDHCVREFKTLACASYVGTSPRFPEGVDVDGVCSAEILERARESTKGSDHEHITQGPKRLIFKLGSEWTGRYVEPEEVGLIGDFSDVRLTVDEPADYAVVYDLLQRCGPSARMCDYTHAYLQAPHLKHINGHIQRNAGLAKSLAAEGQAA